MLSHTALTAASTQIRYRRYSTLAIVVHSTSTTRSLPEAETVGN